MRVLAVDTATSRESVALIEGGEVRGEIRLAQADAHSRRVLPAIEFLMVSLGLRPADVEGYAVTAGPGSFTGLRVGLATVQGLALASGRPALGVSTLEVLAARIRGAAPLVVALLEAGRSEVFAGVFDGTGRARNAPAAGPIEDVLRDLASAGSPVAFTGDAALRSRAIIEAAIPGALFPPRSLFLAGSLGLLAEERLEAGEGGPAAGLQPLYLRGAHIR